MTDTITLNDGKAMPIVGQGVYLVPPADAEHIVKLGIEAGYRAVDTASYYRNESGVGAAVRASGRDIFVTTKLFNADQGRDATLAAFEKSSAALGLDRLDLYLIHWPVPSKNLYVETWKTLIDLQRDGRIVSIGVSNFTVDNLKRIIDATGVVPVTNQIELHPRFQQNELVAFHEANGIATTSWSPLGQAKILEGATLADLAAKHGKTPAQVVLRWHLERGLIAIPKASSGPRLRENLDIFDFALDEADMARIAALDSADGRLGPHPDKM